ncbi:MAG: DUF131 domain-containing protein [Methanobacteriota archaeon]|nr:MAG: DUF131 domain-containing protein [Euryarchaeota archaeon]
MAASVVNGDTDVSLLLIFPVFSGSSLSFLLGTALIVIGLLVWLLTMWTSPLAIDNKYVRERSPPVDGNNEGRLRTGGVVLIGPIPIAFGSSSSIAYAMLALGVIIALVVLALSLLFLL